MPLDQDPWSTALPDWANYIEAGRTPIPALPLYDDQAEKALRIFKRLRVPDLVGTPTFGEVSAPWVFDLVRVIFGSYDPETKTRMIQEFFLLIPKKNTKTTIAAAIILVAAIMNERPRAELLLIAPTQVVAGLAYGQAVGMVELDQQLKKLFHIRDHKKDIRHRLSGAVIVIKSADAGAITGVKSTFILIDETHVFAAASGAEGVFAEVRGALASRPDGFLLQITTQSKEPPAGVFKAELDKARRVRDGEQRLALLPILYELPPHLVERWQDPETWPLVNPNLGRSVRPDFLRQEVETAVIEGPAKLALIASQHFNVEVGVGLKARSWIGAEYWPKGRLPEGLTLDELMARSEVAVVGIDGGGHDDLFGLGVIGRERGTQTWLAWAHAWGHRAVLDRRKDIAPRLHDFAAAGDLTLLGEDDPTGDVLGVADIVERLLDAGLLPEEAAVGLDPYGVSAVIDELTLRGISEKQMAAIGQGTRLSPAIWGMERKLSDGTLRHGGQPMMDWVLGNARTEQRASAVMITKEAAGRAKIDPLVALLDAFMLMSRGPAASGGPSVYETRGLLYA